jgi:hypothetical protein
MVGDAGQHIAKIGFGIEAVEFGCADQAVDGGCALAARVRSGKQVVLTAQGYAARRAFGSVVVDLDVAIVDEAGQRLPDREHRSAGPTTVKSPSLSVPPVVVVRRSQAGFAA